MSASVGNLIIEIVGHRDDGHGTPWAEYDVFEDGGRRVAMGTAPSVFAAIDAVVRALGPSSEDWKRAQDVAAT